MKALSMISITLASALFAVASIAFPVSASESGRFFCVSNEMKAWNSDRTKYQDFMRFLSKEFYRSRYTPEVRCPIVSGRLNRALENSVPANSEIRLGFKTGIVNQLNVICLANSPSSKCTKENLIITLSPKANSDPELALEKFIDTIGQRNSKKIFTDSSSGKGFFPLAPLLAK
jgi:Circadian oscillating protein COP23